jgi:heat shock protein HtpX
VYTAIARNKRNTWFILIGFVLFLGAVGLLAGWLAGNNWWITAFILVFAVGYATVQYFVADREALAMAGAVQVTKEDAPRYYRLVENLCITTGTPMPKLYVVDDPAPNS